MKLTVIIPVYNEENTIEKLIRKVIGTKLNLQIIVVDDCSTDRTNLILKENCINSIDNLILHKENKGKGAAIQSAQSKVKGDYVIIQDADLEYDPNEYVNLIKPLQNNEFRVVYGSRVIGRNRYKIKNFTSVFRVFANHILTIFSNLINSQNLTDAHTCYKVFESNLFKNIKLEENGFSFCPEITTKISNLNLKIKELPINYNGRSYKEGKKIKFYDGLEAIFAIIKYKFFK